MKGSKALRRLERRRSDFDKGPQGDARDRQKRRWEDGGYHRPGSLRK